MLPSSPASELSRHRMLSVAAGCWDNLVNQDDFMVADLTENIEREVAVGGRIGAAPEVSVAQIRKLKRIAAARGYRLVPGHDPVVWPALTEELSSRSSA